MTPIERFLAKVQVGETPDDCWLWTGHRHRGYGQFNAGTRTAAGNQKPVGAHRWSYEHYCGPIPTGLVIDHLCEVRECVNPAHLEVVTNAENIARKFRRLRPTHCLRGHAWTPENTYAYGPAGRKCRRCHADDERERHRAKRAYRKEEAA